MGTFLISVDKWFFRWLTFESGLTKLANQTLPWVLFVGQEPTSEITQLLQGWRGGDRKALDALLPVVYKELQRLAHFQLRQERADHTLQSAALVNEAYLRLVGLNTPQWESRTHFFAIAAQLMRQILVDYARRHRAGKRGGGQDTLPLEDATLLARGKDIDRYDDRHQASRGDLYSDDDSDRDARDHGHLQALRPAWEVSALIRGSRLHSRRAVASRCDGIGGAPTSGIGSRSFNGRLLRFPSRTRSAVGIRGGPGMMFTSTPF